MPAPHLGFLAVRFRDGLPHVHRRRAATACHLGAWQERAELPGESFTLFPVAQGPTPRAARHRKALRALMAHGHVARAATVHRHGALRSVATDRIWIGLRGTGQSALTSLSRRGGRIVETSPDGEHLIELPPEADPWRECARLRSLRSVAWAEPDHVLVGRRFAAARGLGGSRRIQPALRRIGMIRAWRLQPGQPRVIVAVLDDGADASHPDLEGVIVAHCDATNQRSASVLRPRPWDSHGTECAALVAGSGRGRSALRGVAAGCRLAVVRVGYTPGRDAEYVTKASWLRRGVDWAWQNGAAVLSMSFGGGPPMPAVTLALRRARTRGRDGRGCVLVAAAGNGGAATVDYPARLHGVMAVAATGGNDRPADFSNGGRAVAIAAPGVDIRTATIPDRDEPGWYTTDDGTSLATPLVAGAAALVLCAHPGLSELEVRERLCASAERVTGLRYVGGRNDRVGAGRLNVARAVGQGA